MDDVVWTVRRDVALLDLQNTLNEMTKAGMWVYEVLAGSGGRFIIVAYSYLGTEV